MKYKLTKHEKESLDNKIVFSSSAMFLYAMLLAFIQKMSSSPVTVNGALAFIEILRWASLVGAMACAAWSAYKEKKGFFLYCATCLFVFLSTTVIKFCTQKGSNSPYLINYAALVAMFVAVQIYYALKIRGAFEKKAVKYVFIGVCVCVALAFAVVCIININSAFLPGYAVELQSKIFR